MNNFMLRNKLGAFLMGEKRELLPYFLWLDLEMTGLDPAIDTILEVAWCVTDLELKVVEVGPEFIIHHEDERLKQMDEWNRKHHRKSGLWQKSVDSVVELPEAQEQSVAFIRKYFPNGKATLCGNSIWQDRRFIMKYLPDVEALLHYRMVDISSLKVLIHAWQGEAALYQDKKNRHRAQEDILESIDELVYYREKLNLIAEK